MSDAKHFKTSVMIVGLRTVFGIWDLPVNGKGKKGKVAPVLNRLSTVPWRHVREWRYSSTILYFGAGWRWVVSFTPWSLYSRGKSARYPLDRRLGGLQNRPGRLEKSCPYRDSYLRPPGRWARRQLPGISLLRKNLHYCPLKVVSWEGGLKCLCTTFC
jgi:hypothetical protein